MTGFTLHRSTSIMSCSSESDREEEEEDEDMNTTEETERQKDISVSVETGQNIHLFSKWRLLLFSIQLCINTIT